MLFLLSSVFLEADEKSISKKNFYLKLSLGAGMKISKVFFINFHGKDSVNYATDV